MNSPVMLPWKTIIQLQRQSDTPVYLQIANIIILEIKKGRIGPGIKMPGTRQMAELLNVHRKTVVRAYEELDAQGWIEMHPSKGSFTSPQLPEVKPQEIVKGKKKNQYPLSTGFQVKVNNTVRTPALPYRHMIGFHDGPDVRLMPVDELGRAYKSALNRKANFRYFSYVEIAGVEKFRKVMSDYLNASRGLQTSFNNIFITRGSQMALYLLSIVLFSKGDNIIVGETNYYYADHAFLYAGANLVRVPVDDNGIDVDEVERRCKKQKIKGLYITSHHHYPTTVTLSASRRVSLLALAEKYGFVIIEDDYDYDFHYLSSPILPLVSADTNGMVIYIGTLSKTISPGIRTGYIVAPANLVLELSRIRQLIDTQGDPLMELALADMFVEGHIKRHMKKSVNIYHQRRDFLAGLLKEHLSNIIDFKIPDGGLAIWAKFKKSVPLPPLTEKMRKDGIIISNGLIHNTGKQLMNATRLGFGWMNNRETEKAVDLLIKHTKA